MPNLGANQLVEQKLLETVTFLSTAGPRASRLNDALANLPSAFNPRNAVSSNTNLMQIASFSGQNVPATAVVIHQIATTQRNEGTALQSNTLVAAQGLHTFEIEVDGKPRQISFTAEGNVTNRQFQQKMAEAINNANLGITASVTTKGNTSALSLETGTTGPGMDGKPRFTIRDVTGNAATLTGVNNITQEAQNAIFSVNGSEKQTSATNRVDLGGGLVVTLVKASDEEVNISMGQNRFAMQNAARQVVNQFNALLESAQVNGTDRNTRMLIRDLQNAASFSRRDLEKIGIRIGRDGFLTVDESTMSAAAENGTLERFFGNGDSRRNNAFVSRLQRIADSVANNPMSHVSPHASRLPGFNAAMSAVNNPNNAQGQRQAASPFDAYMQDDIMSLLFDALR